MTHRAASRISSRRASACGESFFVPDPSFAMTVDADMPDSRPLPPLSLPCQTHPHIRTIAPYGSIVRWGKCENCRSSVDSSNPGGLWPSMRRMVTLLVVSCATVTGGAASPEVCREAVFLAAAHYDQTTAKVISSCQQRHVPDCDGDVRAAAKVARAAGKLQSSITLRCCGPDRICGT